MRTISHQREVEQLHQHYRIELEHSAAKLEAQSKALTDAALARESIAQSELERIKKLHFETSQVRLHSFASPGSLISPTLLLSSLLSDA